MNTKQTLSQRIGRIPDPENYHRGLPLPELAFPVNVVMFPRPRGRMQFYHAPKIHPFRYVLILALDGNGCVSLNNELYPMRRDTAMLIFPGQLHYYVNLQVRPRQWFFITFQLTRDRAITYLRNAVVRVDAKTWRMADGLAADYLSSLRKRPEIAARISYQLWLMLMRLTAIQERNPYQPSADIQRNQNDYDFLAKVQKYVETRLEEPIRVAELAKHVGISRSLLQNQFSALMGTGIAGYIRRHRLKHACNLMATTNQNMSAIAATCGFSSLFTFSRTFKMVYGMPPTSYRQRMRQREAPYAARS